MVYSIKGKQDQNRQHGPEIIRGAIKSTPIWQMEKMANIQPLETRRNFKIQCQAEKTKRLHSHPLHQKLNQPIKSRLQSESLNPKSQRAREERKHSLTTITCRTIASSGLLPTQRFELSTKIPGIHSKADHPPHMLKALTLETLDHKYPKCSWIHDLIYTNGSAEKAVKNGGSGMIAIHSSGAAFSKARSVGVQSTNFNAEMDALLLAAQHLETYVQQQDSAVMLSDSLSALQTLQSNPTDNTTSILCDNLTSCQKKKGK